MSLTQIKKLATVTKPCLYWEKYIENNLTREILDRIRISTGEFDV